MKSGTEKTSLGLSMAAGVLVFFAGCSQEPKPGMPGSQKQADEIQGSLIVPKKSEASETGVGIGVAQDDFKADGERVAESSERAPDAGEGVSLLTGSIVGADDVAEAPPAVADESSAAEPEVSEPEVARGDVPAAEFELDQDGEFKRVSFEQLASFQFDVPHEPVTNEVEEAESGSDQIPQEIRALNGLKVAVRGFMLPLKVEKGLVTELLLMRDQSMCCYGTVPRINEWVSVKMAEKGVKAVMDQPVTLFGKLSVGEMRENGYLVGIYEMAGEEMTGPLDM